MFADRSKFFAALTISPVLSASTERKEALPEAINSIEKIKKIGKLIGLGWYGEAYLIGDTVYKIYDAKVDVEVDYDEKKGEKPTRLVERCAKLWNEVYNKIYGGIYAKRYAKAEYTTIGDSDVLITPYVKGEDINLLMEVAEQNVFKNAMKILSLGMYDWSTLGNVKKVGEHLLPVDFDRVYRRVKEGQEPLSPTSRCWSPRKRIN